ncbi:MAG: hypothetical protein IAF38_09515 [Bacteroidia bacterium]|nr:hypothetical protein [Bacteroidia bacterium]
MAQNKNKTGIKKKTDELEEKKQEARIKIFFQALDVKRDSNMTRIYSAFQSIKNA